MSAQKQKGFTIVELLIVIVVIGILAAITIVAYNGIQDRARASSVSSALSQANKKLAVYQVDNPDVLPANKTDLEALGIKDSGSVTYQYTRTSSAIPNTYCMTATTGPTSYKISSANAVPSAGGCAGHGVGGVSAITNLVKNPSLESNLTGWAFHTSISGARVQTAGKWTAVATRTVGGATAIYAGRNDLSQLTIGETYTASATVTSPINQSVRIELRNNTSSISSFLANFTLQANVPQRISATGVAGDTTGHVTIWWDAGAINDTLTVDDVMLVQGATNYPYADGNTANWTWNGTVNNATSTGPPL